MEHLKNNIEKQRYLSREENSNREVNVVPQSRRRMDETSERRRMSDMSDSIPSYDSLSG